MNGEVVEQKLFGIVTEYVGSEFPISGGVYYRGLRPIQDNVSDYKEDAVIAFLTGTTSDVQNGTCLVNVYVPDIAGAKSGIYYKDKERCAQIAEKLEKFPAFANAHDKDLFFKQRDMIATLKEDEINQHFVSLKMEFKVLNENY